MKTGILICLIIVLISFKTKAQKNKGEQTTVYNEGVNYFKGGKFLYAINSFTHALELDSTDKDALYNRGVAYYKTGDIKNACSDWRRGYFFNDTFAIEKINKYCDSIAIRGVDTFWTKDGMFEVMPEFPGGQQGLFTFFKENLKYPTSASRMEKHGTVYVSFVIEFSGEISDVKVFQGVGGTCDEEAVRVVKKMPKWKPGLQGRKAVSVKYILPISFNLRYF